MTRGSNDQIVGQVDYQMTRKTLIKRPDDDLYAEANFVGSHNQFKISTALSKAELTLFSGSLSKYTFSWIFKILKIHVKAWERPIESWHLSKRVPVGPQIALT